MQESVRAVQEGFVELFHLLATEAPSSRFGEPVARAQARGADEESLARMERAKDLALETQALLARRQQREAGLVALVDTARELTLPYDLDVLLKVITRRTRLLLGLDMSWVSLYEPDNGVSVLRVADGHISMLTVGMRIPLDGGMGALAATRSTPAWSPDYLNDERITHRESIDTVVRDEGLRGMVAVPLWRGDVPLGVLYAGARTVRRFTPEEITLISSLGDLAAVAIEQTRLLDQARSEISELELGTSRARASSAAAERLRSTHRRLIDLVLGGGGPQRLIAEAGDLLGARLLIRDLLGTCLTGGVLPGIDEDEVRTATLDAHAAREPVRTPGGVWVLPVTAGEECLGALLAACPPDAEYRIEDLDIVVQAAAVLLMLQRSVAIAEGQARDDLFNDLLSRTPPPRQQIAERAHRLAVDLEQPHVVVVVQPKEGLQGKAAVWAASYAHRLRGLKHLAEGKVVLLLPGSDAGAAARAVSKEATKALGETVTAGAAGPTTGPGAVVHTYDEALRCLEALRALGGAGSTASPMELGFLGQMLSDAPNAVGFIRSTIGSVLDYDAKQCTELIRTLECYFASSYSPTRAAAALHVHPNTVARRLERITTLLGKDWQQPDRALEVQLALRLHRIRHLLRGRNGTRSPDHRADVPTP